jgi:hypothetical protein
MLRDQLVPGLVGSLRGAGVELQLDGWTPLDASGVGDQATVSSFRYRAGESGASGSPALGAQFPAQGNGVFVLSTRGSTLSALVFFYSEGQMSEDWRGYTAIVDARVQAEGGRSR